MKITIDNIETIHVGDLLHYRPANGATEPCSYSVEVVLGRYATLGGVVIDARAYELKLRRHSPESTSKEGVDSTEDTKNYDELLNGDWFKDGTNAASRSFDTPEDAIDS